MKAKRVELKVDVKGTEVISAKIEKIAALLEEANAILNDVAKNSTIELDIKNSNQNEYRNSDTLD